MVFEHGGMVDKIVGDAVHAFFNAPLDLDDHPRRAVECAVAIRAWAESYRASPAPAAIGFGRTRIGIETGQAIVGDVGLRSKLDYTAHGDAVNAAARFEAANKELGSAICVGPAAAARCDAGMFRPLGTITVGAATSRWRCSSRGPDAPSHGGSVIWRPLGSWTPIRRAPPRCSMGSPLNFQPTRLFKCSSRSCEQTHSLPRHPEPLLSPVTLRCSPPLGGEPRRATAPVGPCIHRSRVYPRSEC